MAIYHFPANAGQPEQPGPAPSVEAVRRELRRLGLDREELGIAVEDRTVFLTGAVPDAAMHERILLAVGNMRGVTRVDDRLAQEHYESLLDGLAAFAHLPRGAHLAEMAEQMVHEAKPAQRQVIGPAGSVFYTVRPGDSLDEIARRWYGDTNAVLRIMDANRPFLGSAVALAPGTVLRLPVRDIG